MLCARFWLFLGCALLVAAAHPPSLAHADELDDFVAAKVQECKELTRKRDELASQAAQKGNALSPDAGPEIHSSQPKNPVSPPGT